MSLPSPVYAPRPLPGHFAAGELSLLVFGPGHGEAIVVILPDGSLGVLDGCREPTDGNPGGIGDPVRAFVGAWLLAAPGRRIRFVGLTHPHADHYAGLGRLIEAHDPSIDALWCPPVTGGQWGPAWIKYLDFCATNGDRAPTADEVSGLERIIGAFERRGSRRNVLGENKEMLSLRCSKRTLTIRNLAPSANDADRAQRDLLAYMHREERVRHDPNLTSAALLIAWGQTKILLGGDLLCAHRDFEGWDAATRWVDGPVQVVKVSHHASVPAQHYGLWDRMAPHLAIVTPFRGAIGEQPPRPAGIRRILDRPCPLAITSIPEWVQGSASVPLPVDPPRSRSRSMGRNRALAIAPVPLPSDNAVGVSLRADGAITQVVLIGEARLYR